MIDREFVNRKLSQIVEYLTALTPLQTLSYTDYLQQPLPRYAAERLLQLLVSTRPKVFWYNTSLYNSQTMRYIQPISRAMSVRYVRPLTEQQRALLESTMKHDAAHRARMRAHGLLLSSEGITIKAIAKIYHVDRDTVSTWIKKWEKHGAKSLHDQPRS